jgi:23S rRNA pseudouridine1911/1915/1917 synthase
MNTRLDQHLLSLFPELSRTKAQKAIKGEKIKVNGVIITKTGHSVKESDEVEADIEAEDDTPKELKPLDLDIEVLYEDDDLIIFNKPKGLVVHPAIGHKEDTLVNAAMNYTKTPMLVHRLDKDTSGCIIVAKNEKAHELMQAQFKDRTVKKTYVTLVHGLLKHKKGIIDAPIARHQTNRQKMAVRKTDQAREAKTEFEIIEQFGSQYTLLKVNLLTGRTHQIRVHFASIGHPVVGDHTYGRIRDEVETQFLHASEIEFNQPTTGELVSIKSDLSTELKHTLDQICP